MKKVSQMNKDLVREVRENWIIEEKEPNYSLDWPGVNDPSMGQSNIIKKIFNNSVSVMKQSIIPIINLASLEFEKKTFLKMIDLIFLSQQNGFFIECGAYDGETRSNTLNLERYYGWTGLLIEADPINFSKMLQKKRNAYLSPTCLSITSHPQIVSF